MMADPSTPPSLLPGQAAEVLRRHLERGSVLFDKDPLSAAEREAWQVAAYDYLQRAFGSGHMNATNFRVAGRVDRPRRIARFGEPPPPRDVRQEELLYREAMKRQLILLQGSLEQLEELHRLMRRPQLPAPVPPEREYDVAQICMDGHVVNAASRRLPVHNAAFCRICGVATTTTCEREQCKQPIRGLYWAPDSRGTYDEKPSYCHGCGWPYPWTRTALVAARDLAAELDGLDPGDRERLAQSLDDLAKDSPRTMLAAVRFKKLVAKAGPEAAGAFRRILIDVVTKAAKDHIWPT